MILYDMKDDGKDDTCDMKETEAPLNHRFDPHGSHPGGGRIVRGSAVSARLAPENYS